MTEDPRITLAIDHLYAIGESDQAEAIESLRSRLQAVEAERDEIDARARRAQELHMSSAWALVDWHVRADKAEASLAKVRKLHRLEVFSTTPYCAECRDYEGNDVAWPCRTVAALAGGTSPEPTEPACTNGPACMITSHIDCRRPVDVASEPLDRSWIEVRSVRHRPASEPPNPQEQR